MCFTIVVVGELCAAGANFRFHIGNETSETDLLFYNTEASRRISEVFCKFCIFGGGGGENRPVYSFGGSLKCPPPPPGSASDYTSTTNDNTQCFGDDAVHKYS